MYELEDTHWWFLSKRNYVQSAIPKRAHLQILDIGCGTGGTTSYLQQFGTVIGVEKHPVAHRYAASRKLHLLHADAAHIPLKDNCRDVVTILDVLYHRDIVPEVVLSETYRILKPGGILIITDCANLFIMELS